MFLVVIKYLFDDHRSLLGGDIQCQILNLLLNVLKQLTKLKHKTFLKKNAMRTAVKRAKTAIAENAENKNELVRIAVKKVDKASQANLIHSNKADRIKSKLMVAAK